MNNEGNRGVEKVSRDELRECDTILLDPRVLMYGYDFVRQGLENEIFPFTPTPIDKLSKVAIYVDKLVQYEKNIITIPRFLDRSRLVLNIIKSQLGKLDGKKANTDKKRLLRSSLNRYLTPLLKINENLKLNSKDIGVKELNLESGFLDKQREEPNLIGMGVHHDKHYKSFPMFLRSPFFNNKDNSFTQELDDSQIDLTLAFDNIPFYREI